MRLLILLVYYTDLVYLENYSMWPFSPCRAKVAGERIDAEGDDAPPHL